MTETGSGRIRVVPQAHDQRNPLHVCDAADLWSGAIRWCEQGHGFGQQRRARRHRIACRRRGVAGARACRVGWCPMS